MSRAVPALRGRYRQGADLAVERAVDVEEERFAAAVRREFRARRAELAPLLRAAPAEAQRSPRDFVAWLGRRSPGAFRAALDGTAGRPRRPRVVTPVQPLDALPRLVWHGTEKLDRLLLDGPRLPPAEAMGRRGKRGWGWDSGSYRWGPVAWGWFDDLPPHAKASLERQVGAEIRGTADLGRAVSLLFVMAAGPIYASAYTRQMVGGARAYGPVAELDTRRLPVLGYFEDPYVMGDPLVLVLPSKGYQGGPDAVVALREP